MDAMPHEPVALAPPPRPRRRAALIRLVVLCAVIAIAALVGSWWFAEGRFVQTTDNAYVQGDITTLSARVEGDVAAILVADNQPVTAGQQLITLDPRDWQARRDQAAATLEEATASLALARSQIVQARVSLGQTDAQIDQAQAELTRANADAGRSGTLVGAGWTSRQANDQAIAALRKAEAGVALAVAQRAVGQQALSVAETQESVSLARVANNAAALRLAESNLANTIVLAPFDGIVGNRAAMLGQHVQPGAQLIAISPPPRLLFVVANFKETQLRRMHVGDLVVIIPDIDPDSPLAGRVASFAPATGALFSLLPPENATGNFTKVVQRVPIRIALDLPGGAAPAWLRAGLSVTAEVDTRGPDAVRRGLLGLRQ